MHLLGLINEILDLSRIEAGRYELNEEPVVAHACVVGECAHLLQMRAKNRGLTIHEMFETDMPRLWADERAIRQVCLNLLSNAIKFTPQGGEIWLKVGWTASGGQYLSVKDTGPGIPEEEIPIVLASFGQGSNSIKSAEQGAGLGLPIAKNLIDLHGGTFTLQVEAAHRHRGDRHLPAGTGDVGAGAAAEPAPPIQPQPQPDRHRATAGAKHDSRNAQAAPVPDSARDLACALKSRRLPSAPRSPILRATTHRESRHGRHRNPLQKICTVDSGSGYASAAAAASPRSQAGSG